MYSVMKNSTESTTPLHWAWVILAICFINLFINYSIRLGYGVVLPEMIRDLGFQIQGERLPPVSLEPTEDVRLLPRRL